MWRAAQVDLLAQRLTDQRTTIMDAVLQSTPFSQIEPSGITNFFAPRCVASAYAVAAATSYPNPLQVHTQIGARHFTMDMVLAKHSPNVALSSPSQWRAGTV